MSAVDWNRARHNEADTVLIQKAVGALPDGHWGPATVHAVEEWQAAHGLVEDGKVGSKTLAAMMAELDAVKEEWRELTDEEVDKIIERTVEIESAGAGDPYAALNLDAEYEGWFDRPRRDPSGNRLKPAQRAEQPNHKPHVASKYGPHGGIHIGISVGIIQFTLDGGSLGRVLKRAFEIDPEGFRRLIGSDTDELLEVSNRPGSSGLRSKKTRGPRVHPVGGVDLWKGAWPSRFKELAKLPAFRKAQRLEARSGYFDPAIKIVKDYGLSGQGDLAVAFDMCVQYGAGGARKYFKKARPVTKIQDVVSKIGSARGRARREEILVKSDIWVHYEDLAGCF